MKKPILFLISVILISMLLISCNKPIKVHGNRLNLEAVLAALKDNIDYEQFIEIDYLECTRVYEKENEYLVTFYYANFAGSVIIKINNKNQIIDVLSTEMFGGNGFYEPMQISTSQGNFIISLRGKGEYILYSIDDNYKEAYEISAGQFLKDYANNGFMYQNGKLTPDFQDIDGDGHTDIILTGIEIEAALDNSEFEEEFFCKFVYLYDEEKDTFTFNLDNSIYKQVT